MRCIALFTHNELAQVTVPPFAVDLPRLNLLLFYKLHKN